MGAGSHREYVVAVGGDLGHDVRLVIPNERHQELQQGSRQRQPSEAGEPTSRAAGSGSQGRALSPCSTCITHEVMGGVALAGPAHRIQHDDDRALLPIISHKATHNFMAEYREAPTP